MGDSRSPFRGHARVEMLPKDMASNTFKLHDIREIKNSVGGIVNDVVMGVVFYGFRQYCQMELSDPKQIENLRVTAMTLINTRTRRSTKASARVMYNTLANTTLSVTNVNGPMEQLIFEGYKVKNCFFSVSGFPQ
ncbi:hypothetical protein KI387_029515, partial [Taxus chinensis]